MSDMVKRKPPRREPRNIAILDGDEPQKTAIKDDGPSSVAHSNVSAPWAYVNGDPTPRAGRLRNTGIKRLARGQKSVSRRAPSARRSKKSQAFNVSKHLWVHAIIGDIGAHVGDNNAYACLNNAKSADELYNSAIEYIAQYLRSIGWGDVIAECKRAKKQDTIKALANVVKDNL